MTATDVPEVSMSLSCCRGRGLELLLPAPPELMLPPLPHLLGKWDVPAPPQIVLWSRLAAGDAVLTAGVLGSLGLTSLERVRVEIEALRALY